MSATVEVFEVILPKKGQAALRKWDLPPDQVHPDVMKGKLGEKPCPDGCRHLFATDIMKVAKIGAEHDTARMLRKLDGEHSDDEAE